MKRGINALFFAVTLVSSAASFTVFSAPTAVKAEVVQPSDAAAVAGKAGLQTHAEQAGGAGTADGAVSINTASAEELAQALNGIGIKKAQAMVRYRDEYGPFAAIDDLKQVPGFGNALVERNRAHLKL